MNPLRELLDAHRGSVVATAALLAGGWRLFFLSRPLAPDEGGLLLLAQQWTPGDSVYGDYFVDRPPGLVALVLAADALGGEVALRLTVAVAVVLSVLLADRLGRLCTGHPDGGTAAALAAAVYLSLPSSGVLDLNAEMLACPLVLAGLVLVLRALGAADRNGLAVWGWAFGAGCAAALAMSLKQNIADVLVVGVAAAAGLLGCRRGRAAAVLLSALVAGSLVTSTGVLALAWQRGTTPLELWDGLVTFRLEALRVIGGAASDGNAERAWLLVGSLLLSGALVLIAGGWVAARGAGVAPNAEVPTSWLLVPLTAFESVGVLLGGSYWLHYLLLLTPAIIWSAALMATARATRLMLVATLSWALAVSGTGIAVAAERETLPPADLAVVDYLERHAEPGDTAVVAFGRPNILAETGLSSPYSQLWSLPVRVLDPQLRQLRRVLRSPDAPTWVVAAGSDLDTWGVDAAAANQVLHRHYDVAQTLDGATVYRRSSPSVDRAGLS